MWKLFGDGADTVQQVTLFSQRPENRKQRAEITAIAGSGIDFMTDFFAGEAQQGTTTAIRHQAEYDAEEKAWHLVEMKHFDGGAFKNMFAPETVGKTQNIFDALHWCSQFQAFSEQNPDLRIANPGKEYSCGFQHWRDVAKDMKLPIAENGVLVLPEKGRLIPDGHYKGDQIAAAYEVGKRTTSVAPISNSEAFSRYDDVIAKGDNLAADFNAMEKERFQSFFSDSENYLVAAVWSCIYTGIPVVAASLFFQSALILASAPFLVPVAIAMRGYLSSDPTGFPERCLRKRCDEFNKVAALLPDESDRALCREFARQAEFKFWVGRAVRSSVKNGLPMVQKAGESLGLDGDGIDRLKCAYMATHFEDQSGGDILKIVGKPEILWSPERKPGVRTSLEAAMQRFHK